MNSTCGNCKHARQVGDKSVQSIVGCVKLHHEEIKIVDVLDSNIYEGYFYGGRRVGDTSESKTIGKGALTFGLMTDGKGRCKMFSGKGI